MTQLILENQIAIMRALRWHLLDVGEAIEVERLADSIAATEEALRVWVAERRPTGFAPAPPMSNAERGATALWFREVLPDRLNSLDRSAIIVIQQRLDERDVSGTILDLGLPYCHVCVPMLFDTQRRVLPTADQSIDPSHEASKLICFPHVYSKEDGRRVTLSESDSGVFDGADVTTASSRAPSLAGAVILYPVGALFHK
jgi:hypothetical protein